MYISTFFQFNFRQLDFNFSLSEWLVYYQASIFFELVCYKIDIRLEKMVTSIHFCRYNIVLTTLS